MLSTDELFTDRDLFRAAIAELDYDELRRELAARLKDGRPVPAIELDPNLSAEDQARAEAREWAPERLLMDDAE